MGLKIGGGNLLGGLTNMVKTVLDNKAVQAVGVGMASKYTGAKIDMPVDASQTPSTASIDTAIQNNRMSSDSSISGGSSGDGVKAPKTGLSKFFCVYQLDANGYLIMENGKKVISWGKVALFVLPPLVLVAWLCWPKKKGGPRRSSPARRKGRR